MLINEISSQELATMMPGDRPPCLIDVRTAAEVMQGTLAGAKHMAMDAVPFRIREIDRRGPVVFYCRTGVRSAQVCRLLKRRGMDNAINLRGGIMDWMRNGFEVVGGDRTLSEAT